MSHEMFGTDGVRGTPGQYPLDDTTIARLGAAIVHALGVDNPTLLIVRDTRESGPWIEAHLARGARHLGASVISGGVLPTPAASYLVREQSFTAALVVSASHNPFPDNGIKLLTGDGEKASAELERRVAARVSDHSWTVDAEVSTVERRDLRDAYLTHVRRVLAGLPSLPHWRVAVDCANGATSGVAPTVLERLGFDVHAIHAEPDGRNINADCGSTHPAALQRLVRDRECELGMAFDGDGDRVILVDGTGAVVDGDAMLYICARARHTQGQLPGSAVVATVMSNMGLEVGLKTHGIDLYRCSVGDRQVRDAMLAHGVVMGGEQSGHIIFSDMLPTGDGLITALSVLRIMIERGKQLAVLRQGFEVYPQVLVNVAVGHKPALAGEPEIADAIGEAEQTLGDRGRVLVRYSGTEPLLRIMVEGPDATTIRQLADDIATKVRRRLPVS